MQYFACTLKVGDNGESCGGTEFDVVYALVTRPQWEVDDLGENSKWADHLDPEPLYKCRNCTFNERDVTYLLVQGRAILQPDPVPLLS